MDKYKGALEEARKELTDLVNQRVELDKRIAKLRGIVVSLSRLYEEGSAKKPLAGLIDTEPGLTEGCLMALRNSSEPLTPLEVKNALEELGYELGQKNVMASIHTTLKRLVIKKEAKEDRVNGKKVYMAITYPLYEGLEKKRRGK